MAQLRIGDIPNRAEAFARVDEPRVQERAKSIKRLGLINPIVVNEETKALISGRDRLAALMVLGYDQVPAEWITWRRGAPLQLSEVTLAENVERRQTDRDRHLAEYTALLTQGLAAGVVVEEDETTRSVNTVYEYPVILGDALAAPVPVKRGRPVTPQGEARRTVAAAAGITPESVRKAEVRHKAAAKAVEKIPAPKVAPTIKTLGIDVPADVVASAAAAAGAVEELKAAIKAARTALRKTPDRLSGFAHIKEHLSSAAWSAEQSSPASVCPHCKLLPRLRAHCSACHGEGWIDGLSLTYADARLLEDGEAAGVFVDGLFERLDNGEAF